MSNPRIILRAAKYDDKAARVHIKKLVSILETPSVLTNNQKSATVQAQGTKSAPRSRSASQVGDDTISQQKLSEHDEKLQQNYEDFLNVIK